MVSVVAFYSNNLSSNPKVGSLQFLSKVVVEKKEIDKKRLCKEKFHCTTDLQFDWFAFNSFVSMKLAAG